jgi:chloramphenicol-sensitive protein RarD
MTETASAPRSGLSYGVAAYGLWGLLPLYLHAMKGAGALEILVHRILWSLVFLALLLFATRRWPRLAATLRDPAMLGRLALTAVLIAANWLIFIIALQAGHTLEASLGYFINPLVNVALGMIFLRERLRPLQAVAVAIAGAGVILLGVSNGAAPWYALGLAFSFGFYGLIRKVAQVDALEGLTVETMLLVPFVLAYLLFLAPPGFGSFARMPLETDLMLVLMGPYTAIPLLLFAVAARRMPYSALGLLQYIAPTMQFATAVLLFGEAFRPVHAVTFGAIWIGLACYAADGLRQARLAKA